MEIVEPTKPVKRKKFEVPSSNKGDDCYAFDNGDFVEDKTVTLESSSFNKDLPVEPWTFKSSKVAKGSKKRSAKSELHGKPKIKSRKNKTASISIPQSVIDKIKITIDEPRDPKSKPVAARVSTSKKEKESDVMAGNSDSKKSTKKKAAKVKSNPSAELAAAVNAHLIARNAGAKMSTNDDEKVKENQPAELETAASADQIAGNSGAKMSSNKKPAADNDELTAGTSGRKKTVKKTAAVNNDSSCESDQDLPSPGSISPSSCQSESESETESKSKARRPGNQYGNTVKCSTEGCPECNNPSCGICKFCRTKRRCINRSCETFETRKFNRSEMARKCKFCGRKFARIWSLKLHLKEKKCRRKRFTLRCRTCELEMKSVSDKIKHREENKTHTQFQTRCKMIDCQVWIHQNSMKRHMLIHK